MYRASWACVRAILDGKPAIDPSYACLNRFILWPCAKPSTPTGQTIIRGPHKSRRESKRSAHVLTSAVCNTNEAAKNARRLTNMSGVRALPVTPSLTACLNSGPFCRACAGAMCYRQDTKREGATATAYLCSQHPHPGRHHVVVGFQHPGRHSWLHRLCSACRQGDHCAWDTHRPAPYSPATRPSSAD